MMHFWRKVKDRNPSANRPAFKALLIDRTGRPSLSRYDICGLDRAETEACLAQPENWTYLGTGKILFLDS